MQQGSAHLRRTLFAVASDYLENCYNILMPAVEKATKGKDGLQYDDVNYMKTLRCALWRVQGTVAHTGAASSWSSID